MPLYGDPLREFIANRARALGIDPAAALAVASTEGGFGGAIGDVGTSFGPFQLHVGGALPATIWSRGAEFTKDWANRPAGIKYALGGLSRVSRGKTGQEAIRKIVEEFERPADTETQISRALALYGPRALATYGQGAVPKTKTKKTKGKAPDKRRGRVAQVAPPGIPYPELLAMAGRLAQSQGQPELLALSQEREGLKADALKQQQINAAISRQFGEYMSKQGQTGQEWLQKSAESLASLGGAFSQGLQQAYGFTPGEAIPTDVAALGPARTAGLEGQAAGQYGQDIAQLAPLVFAQREREREASLAEALGGISGKEAQIRAGFPGEQLKAYTTLAGLAQGQERLGISREGAAQKAKEAGARIGIAKERVGIAQASLGLRREQEAFDQLVAQRRLEQGDERLAQGAERIAVSRERVELAKNPAAKKKESLRGRAITLKELKKDAFYLAHPPSRDATEGEYIASGLKKTPGVIPGYDSAFSSLYTQYADTLKRFGLTETQVKSQIKSALAIQKIRSSRVVGAGVPTQPLGRGGFQSPSQTTAPATPSSTIPTNKDDLVDWIING